MRQLDRLGSEKKKNGELKIVFTAENGFDLSGLSPTLHDIGPITELDHARAIWFSQTREMACKTRPDITIAELKDIKVARAPLEELYSLLREPVQLLRWSKTYSGVIRGCIIDCRPTESDRNIDLYRKAYGIGAPRTDPLELAREYDLKVMRIQQIVSRIDAKLDYTKLLRFLPLRIVVLSAACDLGYAGETSDLVAKLVSYDLPLTGEIASIIGVVPEISVNEKAGTFTVPELLAVRPKTAASQVAKDATSAEINKGLKNVPQSQSYVLLHTVTKNDVGEIKASASLRARPVEPQREKAEETIGQSAPSKTETETARGIERYWQTTTSQPEGALAGVTRQQSIDTAGVKLVAGITVKNTTDDSPPPTTTAAHAEVGPRRTVIRRGNNKRSRGPVAEVADYAVRNMQTTCITTIDVNGLYALFAGMPPESNVFDAPSLYSQLRRLKDERLVLSAYPWIRLASSKIEGTTLSEYLVRDAFERGAIIRFDEVDALADSVLTNNEIVYSVLDESPMATRVAQGWRPVFCAPGQAGDKKCIVTHEYMAAFEWELAERARSIRPVAGIFYPREHLLADYETLMPPNGVVWTPRLFSWVFGNSMRFKSFGQGGSCIVDTELIPAIENEADFYKELLAKHFRGESSYRAFAKFCEVNDINRTLTPSFLNRLSGITADRYTVKLEE